MSSGAAFRFRKAFHRGVAVLRGSIRGDASGGGPSGDYRGELDSGVWVFTRGEWRLPNEVSDGLPIRLRPPEEPSWDGEEPLQSHWGFYGDGFTAVTAGDLEAAARIIRWHEEKKRRAGGRRSKRGSRET